MNVFISWSKKKSMEYAKEIKNLLEKLDYSIKAFVSEVDINGGEDVQEKIIHKIKECDTLVLCFTKENKKSPWLLFEAGYARGLQKKVIPILFDDDPNWHSWIDNPMNIAREIRFDNENFNFMFLNSFELKSTDKRENDIHEFKNSILLIKEKFRNIDVECEDFVNKLVHSDSFVIKNPYFRNKTAYFLSGFESFELYKLLIDSFMYTGKYLWIYGRKNMKLFSGSYKEFFKYLEEKTLNNNESMDGIDFRCMFLDPDSKEIFRAHPQPDLLETELKATIVRAKAVIRDNYILKKCFRLYSNRREEIIIRLDNCIIYSLPSFDANGRPQLLTNIGFEVFSIDSKKGKECIKRFENVWESAKQFD